VSKTGLILKRVVLNQKPKFCIGALTVMKPMSAESSMKQRSFIDTNILIYAEVSDAPAKKTMALRLFNLDPAVERAREGCF
jgi:hypothetical protein